MTALRLRFGLASRLGAALTLVGLAVCLVTGGYGYRLGRDLLIESTHTELLAVATQTARRVALSHEEAGRYLSMVAQHPDALEMLRHPSAQTHQRLNALFASVLAANPGYFQLRLVAQAEHGLERVRLQREALGLRAVGDDELQEKGHFPFVYETLQLPPLGEYLSRITLDREVGAGIALNQPTVLLSMPVHDAQGQAWGVVVLTIDLAGVFERLLRELPRGYALMLTNAQGDYLVHPLAHKAFGFDRGRRYQLSEDVPSTAALFSGEKSAVLERLSTGDFAQSPALGAFVAAPVKVRAAESMLVLGVTQPLQPILDRAQGLLVGTLQVMAAVAAVCVLVAWLLAQFVTAPLWRMRHALERFAQEPQPMRDLPLDRHDELGDLARGIERMGQQIQTQLAELQDKQEELEHLAQHDVLTGLPNRRFFMQRLTHALAQAARHPHELAVLFMDLDNFKDINDRHGHDAGDALLVALAQRLVEGTRESDTVARLGGDEFVLLVEGAAQREQLQALAQKLLLGLTQPVPWQGHTLVVGVSIGISLYPHDGTSAHDILSQADRAMYRIKSSGKNAYAFFSA